MTADTIGGVWHYAVDLTRMLQPYGVEVALATMGPGLDDVQRRAVSALDNVVVYESTYRLEWMEDPWADVEAAGEWLLDLAAHTTPDLVHLNGYVHGALPWPAPVLVVGHSCVYSWFEGVYGVAPDETWDRYRNLVRQGLQGADLVTAPTRSMLEALQRHYGVFRSGGAVHNARHDADFAPSEKDPVILSAGRLWDEAKNTAALAGAARHVSWPVLVAGEDRHPDNGSLARFDTVLRLGPLTREELAATMGRATIFAHPARYEPFGLTVLEAALSGCALVLGDIPTLRELWDGAAVFVPPDDTDGLVTALQSLVDDDADRTAMAVRARERALTFSPQRMLEGYLALYARLADTAATTRHERTRGHVKHQMVPHNRPRERSAS